MARSASGTRLPVRAASQDQAPRRQPSNSPVGSSVPAGIRAAPSSHRVGLFNRAYSRDASRDSLGRMPKPYAAERSQAAGVPASPQVSPLSRSRESSVKAIGSPQASPVKLTTHVAARNGPVKTADLNGSAATRLAATWIEQERRKLFPVTTTTVAPAVQGSFREPPKGATTEQLEAKLAALQARVEALEARGQAPLVPGEACQTVPENPLMTLVPDILAKLMPELQEIVSSMKEKSNEAAVKQLQSSVEIALQLQKETSLSLTEFSEYFDRRIEGLRREFAEHGPWASGDHDNRQSCLGERYTAARIIPPEEAKRDPVGILKRALVTPPTHPANAPLGADLARTHASQSSGSLILVHQRARGRARRGDGSPPPRVRSGTTSPARF